MNCQIVQSIEYTILILEKRFKYFLLLLLSFSDNLVIVQHEKLIENFLGHEIFLARTLSFPKDT